MNALDIFACTQVSAPALESCYRREPQVRRPPIRKQRQHILPAPSSLRPSPFLRPAIAFSLPLSSFISFTAMFSVCPALKLLRQLDVFVTTQGRDDSHCSLSNTRPMRLDVGRLKRDCDTEHSTFLSPAAHIPSFSFTLPTQHTHTGAGLVQSSSNLPLLPWTAVSSFPSCCVWCCADLCTVAAIVVFGAV